MPRVREFLMRGAGDGWWQCRPLAEEVKKRRMLGKGGRGMEVG